MHDMEEGVVKKKSSSGSLIIKKKGFGASVSKKKKKRLRLESSDSESSDELYEPVRKKIISRPKKVYNKGFVENSKGGEVESERKRSGLDVFEFDEYEKYDGKKMKKYYTVDKKKGSFFDGKKSKHEMVNDDDDDDDDESHLPISLLRGKYRKGSDEPIKLQGKKQKKLGLSPKSEDGDRIRKGSSRSEEVIEKRVVVRPSFYSELKYAQKRISVVKKRKSETKLRKSLLAKSSKARDSEADDITTPPAEKITQSRGNEGNVKRGTGTEKQLLREKIRGMLVNAGWKIDYRKRRTRDYLDAVYISPTGNAYWSITKAYVVFQKQLKEEDNDTKPSGETSPFTPLPEEILSKLTRLTQKKIEREMKMKGSIEGPDIDQCEEKLSFYMKKNRRTPKKDRGEKPSIGRCTLLVRSSNKGMKSKTNGPVPYTGKRTILSWLIDAGVVHKKEKVQYMRSRKTQVMLEGWITRDGIHCGCCSDIVTVSKFEIHAGSKERQPFLNIFVESGLSLMQCQTEAWNKQEESKRQGFHTVDTDGDDPDDDTCGLCGDGGDLICCDGCASTFHQSCLDMETLPPGDWYCPNCTCKFCGIGGGTIAEADGTTSSVHLTCNLCEKKYHESCRQDIDDLPADFDSATTFCGQTCRELFSDLQKLVGVKHELVGGFSWSLIHRMDPVKDMLHLDFCQRVECNSKVPVALSVMHECFLPIVDRRSGVNLMHNVVYNCGSNFTRLNYSGFYTAILERGDEIISAASVRIHGTQIAEMPFIGTRHIYRRQGMCRRLLCAIESVLCSLKVKKLIIPAITEHMHTWTEVFKFNPLEELDKRVMKSINMLVFPGTDMLQKLLMKPEIPKESIAANSDTKSMEEKENPPMLPELAKKSELDSSGGQGHDLDTCDDAGVQHVNGISDNLDAIDSSLQNSSIVINSSVDPPFESKIQSSPNKKTIPINSDSVNKLADSTAELKCLSPSDACPVTPEAGKPVMCTPNKDNIQSGKAIEIQNAVSLDTFNQTDEKSTLQLNFDLNHHSAVEMETKLCAAPEISSKQDACEVNEKVACGSPIPDTEVVSDEAKIQPFAVEGGDNHEEEVACFKSTDEINGKCNPVSAPTLDEGTVKLNSDVNHQSEADEMESQLPVTSESDFEAKSASVDSNNRSSAVGDIDDTHELNVNISANDTAEEIIENQNSISYCNIHESDEITKGFHSNLHLHTSIKVESESSVASKVVSDEVFVPDDAKIVSIVEDDVTVASVELVRDSIGETPVQNSTTPSINEDVRPNGVSDQREVQMKSVSDDHRAKEIETEDNSSAMRRESNIIHPSGEN